MQPRKFPAASLGAATPGCRRREERRKAALGASISRDPPGPRAVEVPAHARKHHAREPGGPSSACPPKGGRPHREVQGRTPMRDGRGKSDSPIVSRKPPNKAGEPAAEAGERRRLAEGNPPQRTTPRTQSRAGVPHALERVRQAARRDRKQRFAALLHHVYASERLRAAYEALNPRAVAGIDGETWRHYGQNLEANLRDLAGRLQRGAYRAKPVRRAYIPKTDGRQRPLGVPALEDKIVQRAAVVVLNAIYEGDFVGFSYGFRPRRNPHQAL